MIGRPVSTINQSVIWKSWVRPKFRCGRPRAGNDDADYVK